MIRHFRAQVKTTNSGDEFKRMAVPPAKKRGRLPGLAVVFGSSEKRY
jgi:hypothetical protein